MSWQTIPDLQVGSIWLCEASAWQKAICRLIWFFLFGKRGVFFPSSYWRCHGKATWWHWPERCEWCSNEWMMVKRWLMQNQEVLMMIMVQKVPQMILTRLVDENISQVVSYYIYLLVIRNFHHVEEVFYVVYPAYKRIKVKVAAEVRKINLHAIVYTSSIVTCCILVFIFFFLWVWIFI